LGQYPNLDQLWPKKFNKPFAFGLDTKLLRNLAEAIGSDTVRIELDLALVKDGTYLRPYRVLPLKGEGCAAGAEGILMPVRVDM